MKLLARKVKKVNPRHWISIGTILLTLGVMSAIFPEAWVKLWQSIVYLGQSFAYYFKVIFIKLGGETPDIEGPSTPAIDFVGSGNNLIPTDIQQFVYMFKSWALGLFNRDVFIYYFVNLILNILEILRWLILIPFFSLIGFVSFKIYFRKNSVDRKIADRKDEIALTYKEYDWYKLEYEFMKGYIQEIFKTKEALAEYIITDAKSRNIENIPEAEIKEFCALCWDIEQETEQLKRLKKFEAKFIAPIRRWCDAFWKDFLRKRKYYVYLFFIAIAFGFDFVSMAVNLVAWYVNATVGVNINVIIDPVISIIFVIIPFFSYLGEFGSFLAILAIFLFFRGVDGKQQLKAMQDANTEYVSHAGVSVLIVGPPGIGKTKMLVSMELDYEMLLRSQLNETMRKYAGMFPYFPWERFEKFISIVRQVKMIYSRADLKKLINDDYKKFVEGGSKDRRLVYGYEVDKYETVHFDGGKKVYLIDALLAYGQSWFLYSTRESETDILKSLCIANLDIRHSFEEKKGFKPIIKYDFLGLNNRYSEEFSHHATNINFNGMRIKKRIANAANDKNVHQFDGGAICVTEMGKETGNNQTRGGQSTRDEMANQRNDGMNWFIQFIRHMFSIDNVPISKFFADNQRIGQITSEMTDVFENKIMIKKKSDDEVALALFEIDKFIVKDCILKLWAKVMDKFRNVRYRENALFHVLKAIIYPIETLYNRQFNRFSYQTLTIRSEVGGTATVGGELSLDEYYIINRKMLAGTYATDCYAAEFDEAKLGAKDGFADSPVYKSIYPTKEEFDAQNSWTILAINECVNDNKPVTNSSNASGGVLG